MVDAGPAGESMMAWGGSYTIILIILIIPKVRLFNRNSPCLRATGTTRSGGIRLRAGGHADALARVLLA